MSDLRLYLCKVHHHILYSPEQYVFSLDYELRVILCLLTCKHHATRGIQNWVPAHPTVR